MPEISDEEFEEAKSAVHERFQHDVSILVGHYYYSRLLKLRCSVNEEIRIGYTPRALIGFFFAYVAIDSYLANDFGWIFSLTFKSALFWFFGYIVIGMVAFQNTLNLTVNFDHNLHYSKIGARIIFCNCLETCFTTISCRLWSTK